METNESPFSNFQNVQQPVEYARFWLRFVAYIIDVLVLWIPNAIISMISGFGFAGMGLSASIMKSGSGALALLGATFVMYALLLICINWLYFAIMESSALQATVGKKAMSIKVTDLNGNRISFGHASGRYFAKIISAMVIFIGYIMAGFTERKQALHDIIANTLVVSAKSRQVFGNNTMNEGY